MTETHVQIVTRKVDKKWEGAILHNNKFVKAFVGEDLYKLISKHIMVYLTNDKPDDTEVNLNIFVGVPDEKKPESE